MKVVKGIFKGIAVIGVGLFIGSLIYVGSGENSQNTIQTLSVVEPQKAEVKGLEASAPIENPEPVIDWDAYWKRQTFTFGENSEQVRQLQDYLKERGYFAESTPSTGYFGTITNDAFQKWRGFRLLVPVKTVQPSGTYSSSSVNDILNNIRSGSNTYVPQYGCAENGSCYGDINQYGVPKTVQVDGYYRSDGTYVRGYYRAKPRY